MHERLNRRGLLDHAHPGHPEHCYSNNALQSAVECSRSLHQSAGLSASVHGGQKQL